VDQTAERVLFLIEHDSSFSPLTIQSIPPRGTLDAADLLKSKHASTGLEDEMISARIHKIQSNCEELTSN
jgi:hypothetical protein